MKFKNVLVTGAGGLLGGYVTRELAGRTPGLGSRHRQPGGCQGIGTFTKGSIEDPAAVAAAMTGQDAVVHVAARPNIWSGQGHEIIHTNVTGTWNVLQAAEEAGVKRVILTSSDSVIGYTVLQGAMLPPRLSARSMRRIRGVRPMPMPSARSCARSWAAASRSAASSRSSCSGRCTCSTPSSKAR